MQDASIVRSWVGRIAARMGVPAELAALGFVVIGVLVVVFPELVTWTLGLVLVVMGAWHLMLVIAERAGSGYARAVEGRGTADARRTRAPDAESR